MNRDEALLIKKCMETKQNVPTLGDNLEAGTLDPVQLPLDDKDYLVYLLEEHPEQYERYRERCEKLLKGTGVEQLEDLNNRSYDKEFIEEVNRHILLTRGALGELLSPGAREKKVKWFGRITRKGLDAVFPGRKREREDLLVKRRMKAAARYGRKVDTMVRNLVDKFFPGHTKALGLRNDTMATHTPGKLLLMYRDEERNNKIRYEAKRKYELMEHAARVDQAMEQKKQHLEFLADLMDERVFDPNGDKKGGTKTQWLVSTHDSGKDNRCIDFEFVDEPPNSLEENQLIEQIDLRTIEVTLPDGTKRKIDFMFDIDEKDDESMWLKSLRHPDRSMESLARDLNRGRFLFKSEEDAQLVINEIEHRIQNPDSETMKSYQVSTDKIKNGWGGRPRNPAIPCNKFNMKIKDGDGIRDFEFQAFTPKNYVNYFCWEPHAWCKHEVYRFFKNNLCETLWPEVHFPGLDREKIAKEAFEREYQKVLAARKILPITPPKKEEQVSKKPFQDKAHCNVPTEESLVA